MAQNLYLERAARARKAGHFLTLFWFYLSIHLMSKAQA